MWRLAFAQKQWQFIRTTQSHQKTASQKKKAGTTTKSLVVESNTYSECLSGWRNFGKRIISGFSCLDGPWLVDTVRQWVLCYSLKLAGCNLCCLWKYVSATLLNISSSPPCLIMSWAIVVWKAFHHTFIALNSVHQAVLRCHRSGIQVIKIIVHAVLQGDWNGR